MLSVSNRTISLWEAPTFFNKASFYPKNSKGHPIKAKSNRSRQKAAMLFWQLLILKTYFFNFYFYISEEDLPGEDDEMPSFRYRPNGKSKLSLAGLSPSSLPFFFHFIPGLENIGKLYWVLQKTPFLPTPEDYVLFSCRLCSHNPFSLGYISKIRVI